MDSRWSKKKALENPDACNMEYVSKTYSQLSSNTNIWINAWALMGDDFMNAETTYQPKIFLQLTDAKK
jgi:hypothetical protein